MNCLTCGHWKNRQRDLNYSEHYGFCVNPKFRFNTIDGQMVGVVDHRDPIPDPEGTRGSMSKTIETLDVMKVHRSPLSLTTASHFGCIFHEKQTKK